ncbi:hypothetical protein DD570_17455 [Klebsiella pneumoniae]|nr:hypothetical protein DD570_17455 [Klebsiella pneumoniae]
MTPPGSEHITSGSGEKQTHTAALRTSLQQEDRLLRAEEQGIIDQGALTTRALRGYFMVCGKGLLTSF